jgi:histone deacetylase HOS3
MPLVERPPVTANSVAKEYFTAELEAHPTAQAATTVIVHDSCYGHRFSRPRATKNALATVVERPERIHATVLGASAAYVRLGGRHAGGDFAPRPKHDASKVRDIPFQIRKTARIIPLSHPSVAFVHGAKWMEELQIMCDTAEGKLAMNGKELVRPIGYGKDENGQALPKLHEGDLYLCAESLAAFQGCLGGVCDAVDTVFSSNVTKRAFVCIRPPGHHCSSNYPSGFCWLNNVHVGIAYAAMNHGLTHAAIIDFDLHHGDGSQNIAWDHNRKAHTAAKNAAQHKKTPIGYYSIHDINSYPCEWGDEEKVQKASLCIENAHGQSIWNVHLEPWKSIEEFWKLYETKYKVLLEKTRLFLRYHTARIRAAGSQQPRAAVFISAGFDASEWEGAGMQRHSVNVPTEFYARFTADITQLAQEDDLGVDGRVISVLEGGYSDRALTSGVLSHICGLAAGTVTSQPATELADGQPRYQTINNWVDQVNATAPDLSFSPEWWALHNLEELEAAVAGRQPPPKGYKDKTGDYASPTQASTLKMTDHARERQTFSNLQAKLSSESRYEPPPPDVDWAIAAYELSRTVIPNHRQTLSCTHEELNAEATKTRRERQSAVGVPAPSDVPMQLRIRKPKPPPVAAPAVRAASRTANRRTTIAAVSDLPDPTRQQSETAYTRPRRRSSDASSILSSFQGMKLSDGATKEKENMAVPKPTDSQLFSKAPSRAPSVVPSQNGKVTAVKKPRAPPATKAPVKPKSSPRKTKEQKPRVIAQPVTKEAPRPLPRGPTEHAANEAVRAVPSTIPTVNPEPDSIENLTNGMKKISIKLKMPTIEQHMANEQQKVLDQQRMTEHEQQKMVDEPQKVEAEPRKIAEEIQGIDEQQRTQEEVTANDTLQSTNGDDKEAYGKDQMNGAPEPNSTSNGNALYPDLNSFNMDR